MFLKTAEEEGSDYERQDPMRAADPYDDAHPFEARSGAPLAPGATVATALAVAEGLKEVYDPELPSNVYDLGLVYDINVSPAGDVRVLMTLTSPNCPAAEILPGDVAEAAAKVAGVGRVGVEITFDPAWHYDYLSERARVELNLF